MKLDDELPGPLWPFCAREIYGFTLTGPLFVFAQPVAPRAAVIVDDIRSDKFELSAALKYLRRPNLRPLHRQRAAARIAELRASLVKRHLQLRRLSIGYCPSPTAPVHLWP